MNFFKDITDELEQAVNDIEVEQTEEDDDLFDLVSESDDAEVDQELVNDLLAESEEDELEAEDIPVVEAPVVEEPAAPVVETPAPVVREESRTELSEEERKAVTVITKGTTINGSIISDCSLDVMGTINGDIECLGKLTISGKVSGNSMASDVVVNTDRLEGTIVSEGNVKIGVGTVVIGDVTATSASFAGAIKGEIDVKGPVVLDSTAIIKGNIKAKSIRIDNGAIIDGFCSLSYADLKIDEIFE